MNKYVIYKEFGKLRLTNEANYNTCMRNASQVIDVNNFANAESVRDYLIREWRLLPHQIVDKTND